MAKHLVDPDEQALGVARLELDTSTIRGTVHAALKRTASQRGRRVVTALDCLADMDLSDRAEAWR